MEQQELKLPPGFRFKPTDIELVDYYLARKVNNKQLPPSKIREVRLYDFNPENLTANNNNKSSNGAVDEWYFFTSRQRKYKNGKRPARKAGDGYWKATGADKEIKSEGRHLGSKKTLVFYKGKPPKGDKTNWIMHEFVLNNPPARERKGDEDMQLDEWVLCRLYKKQNLKSEPGAVGNDEEQDEAADANIPDQTETHIQEYHGIPTPQSEEFQANNVMPQQTFPMPSYNAYPDSASGGLPQLPGCYNAYDYSASGGLQQFPGCYNAYDDSASGGLPQSPGCYNAYNDSAYGGLPQSSGCYNAYDDSASGGLPQSSGCYNAYDDSASGGLPQSSGCYNAYDDSASGGLPQSSGCYNAYDDSAYGGLPQSLGCYNAYDDSASGGLSQFPECYYDPNLEHNSTIIPGQAVSDYGNFIPTVAPMSSMIPAPISSIKPPAPIFPIKARRPVSSIKPPAPISSMRPAPISSMPLHQFHSIHQRPQQQLPSIANNFLFSPADQFLLNEDIGLRRK